MTTAEKIPLSDDDRRLLRYALFYLKMNYGDEELEDLGRISAAEVDEGVLDRASDALEGDLSRLAAVFDRTGITID